MSLFFEKTELPVRLGPLEDIDLVEDSDPSFQC